MVEPSDNQPRPASGADRLRVLVAGGAGSIGQEVVEQLASRGVLPVVYDRLRLACHSPELCEIGDIGDRDRLIEVIRRHRIGAIINLASVLQFGCDREPDLALEVNVMGALAVLEAARIAGVRRVVLSGSLATFGSTSERLQEPSPIQADVSLYGVTKLLGEKLAQRYNVLHGMDCICLRYAAVLSKRPVSSPGVAAALATIFDAAAGRSVVVRGVGSQERRHYAFTSDIALGTVLAALAKSPTHGLFNIAGGDDCYASFQEIADLVRKFAPNAGEIVFEGRSGDRGRMDISRARAELGYEPSFTIEQAIRTIVDSRQAAAAFA